MFVLLGTNGVDTSFYKERNIVKKIFKRHVTRFYLAWLWRNDCNEIKIVMNQNDIGFQCLKEIPGAFFVLLPG
jgi:hypothetical protein